MKYEACLLDTNEPGEAKNDVILKSELVLPIALPGVQSQLINSDQYSERLGLTTNMSPGFPSLVLTPLAFLSHS